ncbi:kinetoplast-associated protein kap-like protein [Verticillium dahliae]
MSRRHTTIVIDQGHPTSRSNSFSEGEDSSSHQSQEYSSGGDWGEEYTGEIDPDESASASAGPYHHSRSRSRSRSRSHHAAPRRHVLPHRPSAPGHYRPAPPDSLDSSEDYGSPFGARGGPYGPPGPVGGHNPYFGGRGGHQQPAPPGGYPQSHVGGYMPSPYGGPQQSMVPYGNFQQNPFSPMSNGSGQSYFEGGPRHPYHEMMPYQHGGYYSGHGGYQQQIPPHMQQYMYSPPPPPATEAPAPRPKTPAAPEPPKPDPEKEKMQEQLKAFQALQAKKEEEERRREFEAKIRRDTEEQLKIREDARRKATEEAKKEFELAKAEAERAAREKMEAERKHEAEQAKLHAETMARIQREAKEKYEAEMKAAAEQKKREDDARAAAEAAARAKFEAQLKAEAEAKLAADKKAAEDAAAKKKWEEETKAKAEAEARAKLEAETKAAEKAAADAAEKKKEEEAMKKKLTEEAKAKFEEDAKKTKDKAPIKFKDAVGRKFSFPFHLCAKWEDMQDLIKQAFQHVDVIGQQVQDGHYDLIGPNGDIILPQVWDKVLEPDWTIEMRMWPESKSAQMHAQRHGIPPGFAGVQMQMRPGGGRDPREEMRARLAHMAAHGQRPMQMPPGMMPAGARPGGGGHHVPPPPHMHRPSERPGRGIPPGVDVVTAEPPKRKSKTAGSGFASWVAGKPSKKKYVFPCPTTS